MWTVIKFKKDKLFFLKQDLKKNLGKDYLIYQPKTIIQKYKNNKLINKEVNLLGDYLFCYHKRFSDKKTLDQLKFLKGLKYFINNFKELQNDLESFILRCKNLENDQGFITQNLFEINKSKNYQFYSGPFVEKIFSIASLQNDNLNILIGNIKTKINKKQYLFKSV